ncbi:Extradiol aromatic ring-opening dioxygenase [Dorcoceras hygrometricum]|uniref:Extradiol aromatic ring-opening dioxygenase n=1 Tax=Dorcoceras hygrometricum TaxID=472368 RepID=A0A2Z7AVI9_9LAMI|nr:Extradiol aromatic ring-opening dioxygenase [Dorcoceras hygrometricum]
MGATHSSQHTVPDAKHSSTRCCPTHEMWELPIPLMMANRSQLGDEVYGSYPLVLNGHPGKMSNTEYIQQYKAYTAAIINIHAQSKAVKQAHIRTSNLLYYNYYNRVPSNTDLTPAKPNTNTSSGTNCIWTNSGNFEIFENLVRTVDRSEDVSISWLLSVDDVSITALSLVGENLLVDLMASASRVGVVGMTQAFLLRGLPADLMASASRVGVVGMTQAFLLRGLPAGSVGISRWGN